MDSRPSNSKKCCGNIISCGDGTHPDYPGPPYLKDSILNRHLKLKSNLSKFGDKGFQVAVIDAPYDKFGYMSINRMSEEHRTHVSAVADYMKSKANVPVWLVGTSMGTVSVANIAINDPDPYAGAVFTSTFQDVAFEDLSSITLPTLVVHHQKDACNFCSPLMAEKIYTKLTGSSSREIRWIEGGYSTGDVCGPNAHHGFLGVEQKAVDAIAEFILSRPGK